MANPTAPLPVPRSSRRTLVLAGGCLAMAAAAVYQNSFGGPFIFDDFLSIPQNPTIRSLATALVPPGGGVTVTGRPVLNLSFALNYALSGDAVWSYHVVNLLIHVVAGLTLFGLVRRTLARVATSKGVTVPGQGGELDRDATYLAFGAALLWILHPLQTEAVTYVVQRAESLMGLFYLVTIYAFVRGVEAAEKRTRGSGGWYTVAVASCLLGMGTKEVMVSAPVIALLYDRTFVAGSFAEAWRRRWRLHVALLATWFPLAVLVVGAADRGGSAGFGVGVNFWSYGVAQCGAVAHYLRLALWPSPLIIDYGSQTVSSAWQVIPYAVGVGALVFGTTWALVRRPALGFLGFCFFAILAPSSLVPVVRQTLAEHRMYLALAPVAVVAMLVFHRWLGRRSWIALLVAAVSFGCVTIDRNTDYRSSLAIWRDTVAKCPGNSAAQNNYGNLLAQEGKPGEALAHYQAALRIDPGYAEAYSNAGNALARLGRPQEAIANYEQALRLRPQMADVETALGAALDSAGRGDDALAHYRRALQIDPGYVEAHNDLGIALARAGNAAEAAAQFNEALKHSPNRADLRNNLGNALRMQGRTTEAMTEYRTALRLDPDFASAHRGLANALRDENRLPEAIEEYERALRGDPDQPDVQNDLGMTLLIAGRAQDAIAPFVAALRLEPRNAQFHLNLAGALLAVGRDQESAAQIDLARRFGISVRDEGK